MRSIDHSERIAANGERLAKVEEPITVSLDGFDSIDVEALSRIPAETPQPCPTCRLGAYWRSVYDLTLRCAECSSWPAERLVRDVWFVVTLGGGEYNWVESARNQERRLRRGEWA
jgi:hypothetical protein